METNASRLVFERLVDDYHATCNSRARTYILVLVLLHCESTLQCLCAELILSGDVIELVFERLLTTKFVILMVKNIISVLV